MAWRSYTAPPDDPNGNAGKLIWTDDQGHFIVGGSDPGAAAPAGPAPTGNVPSGGTPGENSGIDPRAVQAAYQLADAAAQRAYYNAVLKFQQTQGDRQWTIQQEQQALAEASDAWHKAVAQQGADVQTAIVSGYMPNQGPSVKTLVDQGAAKAQQAGPVDDAGYRNIWKQAVPGMNDAQAADMHAWGANYWKTFGHAPTDAEVNQRLQGMGLNAQAPTLAREQEQNKTGLGLLDLASRLRGPDNAFAYADTLANVPDSMRAQLNAMMQRSGQQYTGPGLGAVAGQLTSGSMAGAPTQQIQGGTPDETYATRTAQTGGEPGAIQTQPVTSVSPDLAQQMMLQKQQAGGGGGDTHVHIYPQGGGDAQTTQMRSAALPSYQGPAVPGATAGAVGGGAQHLYQMAPQQWGQTNDYVKRLMLAGLEHQGNDKDAEVSQFNLSLPKYAGPTSGRYAA